MGKTLLVVDDDPNIRKVLSLSFRALGYQVLEAADGEEGERAALAAAPDLILLDVMMPRKNGYTVCRDLKVSTTFRQVPIVLLTAKNQREDVHWGFDCGADAYVTKPYDARRLEALVAELLREASEGRRRVAWTGLPSDARVQDEYQSRLAAGGAPALAEMRLPDRGREVFVQKYGTARLRDLVHRLSWSLHEVLQEAAPGAVLGQRGDDSYLVILPPGAEEAAREALLRASEPLLDGAYDPKDAAAGAISFKDPLTREAVSVPLLRLEWRRCD